MARLESSLQQKIEGQCESVFNELIRGLKNHHTLVKPFPDIHLSIEDDNSLNAAVLQPFTSMAMYKVRVSGHFLAQIYKTVKAHEKMTMDMMGVGGERVFDATLMDPDDVLDTVFKMAIHFVLLHELFHVLFGHMYLTKDNNGQLFMSERSDLVGEQNSDKINRYYFLELEADNSAIEWMIAFTEIGDVSKLLERCKLIGAGKGTSLSELDYPAKQFAYKLLFISVWLVIALFENDRLDPTPDQAASHPMPKVRLITAIHSMIKFYALLSVESRGEQGLFVKLDDPEIESIHEFTEAVSAPFIIFFREFPNAAAGLMSINQLFKSPQSSEVVEIIRDANLQFSEAPSSSLAIKQIDSIRDLRFDIVQELSLHTFLKEQN